MSTPRWSPDSRLIAYVRSNSGKQESSYFELNADRNTDIYIVSANGGEARRLTPSPGPDSNPVWSPDGSEVAYVSQPDVKSWADKADIVVVPAGGGAARGGAAGGDGRHGGSIAE